MNGVGWVENKNSAAIERKDKEEGERNHCCSFGVRAD